MEAGFLAEVIHLYWFGSQVFPFIKCQIEHLRVFRKYVLCCKNELDFDVNTMYKSCKNINI